MNTFLFLQLTSALCFMGIKRKKTTHSLNKKQRFGAQIHKMVWVEHLKLAGSLMTTSIWAPSFISKFGSAPLWQEVHSKTPGKA